MKRCDDCGGDATLNNVSAPDGIGVLHYMKADCVEGLKQKLESANADLESAGLLKRAIEAAYIADVEMFQKKLDVANLQNGVLKRIADAASKVVRGCDERKKRGQDFHCTCDDCTHLSVCLGAYFNPEPEVEMAWFARRDAEKPKCEQAPSKEYVGGNCPTCGRHDVVEKRKGETDVDGR